MIPPASDVIHFNHQPLAELALQAEIPLVDGGEFEIGIHYRDGCRREWSRLPEGGRADIGRRLQGLHRREPRVGLANGGVVQAENQAWQIVQHLGGEHERVHAIIGDAVVRTNGGLAGSEWIPCDAERRPQVAEAVLEQRSAHPGSGVGGRPAEYQRLIRVRQHRIGRSWRHLDLPSQADVDRQIAPNFPAILGVKIVFVPMRLERQQPRAEALPVRSGESALQLAYASQQEIDAAAQRRQIVRLIDAGGNIEGGVIDVGVEVDIRRGVVGTNAAARIDLAPQAEVGAELERMVVPLVGEIVHELPGFESA